MSRIYSRIWMATILCASSLFVTAAGAQTPPETRLELDTKGMKPITGAPLRKFLLGHTLYFRQWDRKPDSVDVMAVLYRPDGVRYVLFPGMGVIKSNWSIENDRLCEEDFRVSAKTSVCRSLYAAENAGAACETGADYCHFRFRWAEGNPEKLGQ